MVEYEKMNAKNLVELVAVGAIMGYHLHKIILNEESVKELMEDSGLLTEPHNQINHNPLFDTAFETHDNPDEIIAIYRKYTPEQIAIKQETLKCLEEER